MVDMLERICRLGFGRARLYIVSPDPRYLDGFASYGEHGGIDIQQWRLDQEKDGYCRATKNAPCLREYRSGELETDRAREEIRPNGEPWLEVPLRGSVDGGEPAFVGKISIDNATTGRPLDANGRYWGLPSKYAEKLGPIIAEARKHWVHEDRAEQMRILRGLDMKLVQERSVRKQMETIVEGAPVLLRPDHCHIRLRLLEVNWIFVDM